MFLKNEIQSFCLCCGPCALSPNQQFQDPEIANSKVGAKNSKVGGNFTPRSARLGRTEPRFGVLAKCFSQMHERDLLRSKRPRTSSTTKPAWTTFFESFGMPFARARAPRLRLTHGPECDISLILIMDFSHQMVPRR